MPRRGEIAGVVDFGSWAVRVLIARQDDTGAIRVMGHGSAPSRGCVKQGVIQDAAAARVALRQAVTAAEREARVRVRSLFCGVNGKNVETFVREGKVSVPRAMVEIEQMQEARDIASRDLLAPGTRLTSPVTAQEWYVDDLRVTNPLGIRGSVLMTRMHFTRLPEVIEDNIAMCIESQHRELEDLVFMPMAAAMGCLTPEDMDLGVAVLDMGHSTTGLAVYRNLGIRGTRVFDFGSHHITRDVAAVLNISFEEADELIREYGLSDEFLARALADEGLGDTPAGDRPPDTAAPRIKLKTAVPGAPESVPRETLEMVIYDRVRELLTQVRQHLRACSLSRDVVRGVVLTGGASRIRNQVKLAAHVFECPCRVGMPGGVETLPHAVASPEFTGSVGVVHHAFQYREAARGGLVDARGGARPPLQRLMHALRRYLF